MRAYMHVQRWGVSGEGLDPLINRIARNLLIDRHRRIAPHLVPLDSAAEVQDPGLDPTEEVIRRQRRNEVRTAVQELPDRHQTAIMYSMGGMSPAEVGDRLGIGRNAADALLHRARRSLKERLRHVGEGAFGFGLWFRIKARNAAAKAGLAPTVEAAGVTSVSAGIAAAAAIVAAVSFVSGGSPSAPAGMAAGRVAAPAVSTIDGSGSAGMGTPADTASAAGGSLSGSGGTYVGLPGGGGIAKGNGGIRGNSGVDNPADPDQKLLGVAPDVIHEDNDESVTGQTFDDACSRSRADCSQAYQEPVEPSISLKRR